jgi:predicted lipoprotein with Yx(FWY)xxD motif
MKTLALLPLAILAFAAPALAASPVKAVKTEKGEVAAAPTGMTLYTYKKDEKGTSNCYDKCATNWPPFTADGAAKPEGAYSLVTRKDGTKQWAKDGMPLYFWIKDTKEGEATGDGVGGVWDVVKP